MRTALSNDCAFDECVTTVAWLALAVDAHVMIVLACLAPQVPVIVEGCPSMLYPLGEYSNDSFMQQVNFARGQAISSTRCMNTSIMKCLVSIVSHPATTAWSSRACLMLLLRPAKAAVKCSVVKVSLSGSGPRFAKTSRSCARDHSAMRPNLRGSVKSR